MSHAPDREYGCCGSYAAALQTRRQVHHEQVRQSIQHGLARGHAPGRQAHDSPVGWHI